MAARAAATPPASAGPPAKKRLDLLGAAPPAAPVLEDHGDLFAGGWHHLGTVPHEIDRPGPDGHSLLGGLRRVWEALDSVERVGFLADLRAVVRQHDLLYGRARAAPRGHNPC